MAQKRKMIIDSIYAAEEKDEDEIKASENETRKTQSKNKLKNKTTLEINGSNYEINF